MFRGVKKIAISNEQTDETGNNRASPIVWTTRRESVPHPPSAVARNFKIRTNKLLEAGIIVRSQELGRSLSAGRESRFAAEHSPGV